MDERLEELISGVYEFMKEHKPDTDEYAKSLRNLKELYGLRKVETEPVEEEGKVRMDPQIINILGIIVPAVTSILGIGMIIHHEQLNVITTKALGFVTRGRL